MMTDTTEVQRFEPWEVPAAYRHDIWVRATDYDALAAKLAKVEADTHKIMVAYATAHAAVLGVAKTLEDAYWAREVTPTAAELMARIQTGEKE